MTSKEIILLEKLNEDQFATAIKYLDINIEEPYALIYKSKSNQWIKLLGAAGEDGGTLLTGLLELVKAQLIKDMMNSQGRYIR